MEERELKKKRAASAHLGQQIPQGDGLPEQAGHADGLAVLEEIDQLHQHDDQPVGAVQAQAVQGSLEAGHVAVVVGAPDVDGLEKPCCSSLLRW